MSLRFFLWRNRIACMRQTDGSLSRFGPGNYSARGTSKGVTAAENELRRRVPESGDREPSPVSLGKEKLIR